MPSCHAVYLPPGSASVGDVVVVSNSGAIVTKAGGWTYLAVASVSDIEENSGQNGTMVTISGENLLMGGNSLVVTLAGVEAPLYDRTDTTVVVRAVESTPIQGDVRLVADTGAFVNVVNGWTFEDPGVITELVPNNGWTNFEVEIVGTKLRGGGGEVVKVVLAGIPATIASESDESVHVVVNEPKDVYTEKTGNVVMYADTGATLTKQNAWTYNVAGKIDSVAPNNGREGTVVVLEGTDLLGRGDAVTSLTLGGVEVLDNIISFSETKIEVVASAITTKLCC